MLKENKAFTFLEMFVVLLVVILIFYIININLHNFYIQNMVNKDADKIGLIVQKYQNLALVKNEKYKVMIRDNKMIINSRSNQDNKIFVFKTKLNTNFVNKQIIINIKGNLSQGGTITCQKDKIIKKIIFSIGLGSYRIE